MPQKITWMRCLIIGISFLLFACVIDRIGHYNSDVNLYYINATDQSLSYYHSDRKIFEVGPNETKSFINLDAGSSTKPTIETCCNGLLEERQGSRDILVVFESESEEDKCLLYKKGEGPTTFSNYAGKQVNEAVFEFTYTFTNKDFDNAGKCPKVNLYYINATDQSLSYYNELDRKIFEVGPNETKSFINLDAGPSTGRTIETCCNNLLGDFQGSRDILVVFESENEEDKCLLYKYTKSGKYRAEGEGPTIISNYAGKQLSEGVFDFTYVFTNKDFDNAGKCPE